MPDRLLWPVQGESQITNEYGRPQVRSEGFTGSLPDKNVGLDIGAKAGTPIPASADGVVVESGWSDAGYGFTIVVRTEDGHTVRQSHMQAAPTAKSGERVRAGQIVGAVGQSGNATGPHVDLELRDPQGRNIDPTPLLRRTQGAGATTVADNAQVKEYTTQRDELQARLDKYKAAQKLVADYQADSKTPTPQWLKSRGISQADLDAAKAQVDAGDIQKKIDSTESSLFDARAKLAKAQEDSDKAASTTPAASSQYLNTDSSDQFILKRKPDGTLELKPDGTPVTIPNPNYRPPAAPAERARRTQVRGDTLIDLDTGTVIAQLPAEAKNKRTQVVGNNLIDLDTGATIADLTAALAKPPEKPGTLTSGSRVFPTDPTTGLPQVDQGVDTLPPGDRARLDESAGLDLEIKRRQANPAPPALADPGAQYTQEQSRRQALARAERDRLLKLQTDGVLTADVAAKQFEDYWAREVDAPLSGLRAMAERQKQQDKLAQETAQRTEDQRAEGINRERETFAFEAGNTLRDNAAKIVPDVRSAAFMDKFAQSINSFGNKGVGGPQWSAADFQPDAGQVPDLAQMAAQETARALQHISPAAAARIGAPLPEIPAQVNLSDFIARYGQQRQPPTVA